MTIDPQVYESLALRRESEARTILGYVGPDALSQESLAFSKLRQARRFRMAAKLHMRQVRQSADYSQYRTPRSMVAVYAGLVILALSSAWAIGWIFALVN